MQVTDERESKNNQADTPETVKTRKSFRHSSTADVRAILSDLSARPLGQREFLCKLLKHAATKASRKDFVVQPADTHHKTTP